MTHPLAVQQYQAVQRLLGAGDVKGAALACKALTEGYPDFAPGWAIACRIALALGNPGKAVDYIEQALILAPESARFLILKAVALRTLGAHAEAESAANAAAVRCGSDAASYHELGNYYTGAGAFREALSCYTRAVELAPESADFVFNRATLLRIVGDLEEAEREYTRLIALKPDEYEAYYNRADLREQVPERNHVAELDAVLATRIRHPRGEVFLRHALAKELEDLGHYRRSFEQLSRAAALRRTHIEYDVRRDVATVEWIEAAFSPEYLRAPQQGQPSSEPIFIVGMPRTGTTLLERVLGQHPDVFAAGELPHFANALTAAARTLKGAQRLSRRDLVEASAKVDFRALGADYLARTRPGTGHHAHFVDKLPLNYLYCGLIHMALPNARIVHLTRHPMATCYAIYKTLFKDAYPFSYDLGELARYYAAYRRLMRYWHSALPGVILDVSYESLVANLELEARRVLGYCGLEWQPACADFHRNPTPTATASASQVRRPLYDSSVGLWERYENELKPLRAMLIAEGVPENELDSTSPRS
jgi:tetratricopeptide (TPR) repeat protein